jgi:hypothetical protein
MPSTADWLDTNVSQVGFDEGRGGQTAESARGDFRQRNNAAKSTAEGLGSSSDGPSAASSAEEKQSA